MRSTSRVVQWAHLGSNQGPLACEASALPLSYAPERAKGIGGLGTFRPVSPATLTPPRERARRGTGSGLGRPWRVIVLNDDHNTFQGVAYALSNVLPGVSYEKGLTLANRIHSAGQAIVWSGEKETAELYWSQLRDLGLTMAPLEQ
jgi:ATP-dependent Clp protease adaptor protein ClpS